MPPTPSGEVTDRWVDSYLNDECSLGEMVKALIRERGRRVREEEEEKKEVKIEIPTLEDDEFVFFQREIDWFEN
jgi:hypothetical protein